MSDDRRKPNIGEQMNSYLYLDPGFTADRQGGLIGALREEIDETVERAKHAPKPPQPEADTAEGAGAETEG